MLNLFMPMRILKMNYSNFGKRMMNYFQMEKIK